MTARRATLGFLVLAAAAISLCLLAPDSDGAMSSFDGVMYGIDLERHPLEGISGHHPLFHVIGIPLTAMLRQVGVATPGHVAIRLISGAGACVSMLLIALASGRARWAVGAGFAAVLFATRGFVIDAAVGESILPGCAAALWVMLEATRTRLGPPGTVFGPPGTVSLGPPASAGSPLRLHRVAFALVVALLLRQDNILLVPGVVVAVAWGMPRGRRLVPIAKILATAGLATLAGYAACWWAATRGAKSLPAYLFYLSRLGWTAPDPLDPHRVAMHVDALGAAVTGRTWAREDLHLLLGPAFLGALVVAALLLRARTRIPRMTVAVAITLLLRAAFYSWFDAGNPEWSVLTIALVALWGSRLADGEPAWPAAARVAGAAVLAACAALALWGHASDTWRLRDRELITAVQRAVGECRDCRFIAYGWHVVQALDYLGVPSVVLPDDEPVAKTLERVGGELAKHPEPTMIVMDRWVISDDPWDVAHASMRGSFLDSAQLPAGVRLVRHRELAFAAHWVPGAESRK